MDNMQELKTMKIWVCWKYEMQNGKLTKVPKSAKGFSIGNTEKWHKLWMTYDEATNAKEDTGADGVAFVLPDGYFFLDADDYSIEHPFIQMLLKRFNTYAETSASGKGIHIYGKCDISKLPIYVNNDGEVKLNQEYYQKNPHNRMELYISGIANRFVGYTGNAINDMPIIDCTEEVLTTLNLDMRRKETPVISPKAESYDSDAFDIVCGLRKQKNADKFSKLFDEGDYYGYGSQSEADAALCAMIAFRTGDKPKLIDDVFRLSALYREKWEREDYRNATISLGIKACNGTFHKSAKEVPEFIRFKNKTNEPIVIVPLLAKYVREHLEYILVKDSGRQCLHQYVYENGCYQFYSKDMMFGVIKKYIVDYDEELLKMGNVFGAWQDITTDLNYVKQDELDSCENLINFKNGLLKVTDKELTLMPHTPSIYSTIQIPCDWTGCFEPTPVFDKYMHTLTNGDKSIERLLLEFIGVCISNIKGYRMKKALFLVGDGNTGKSQLKSLVERMLGKGNFIGIDLKEIEARFGTGAIYGTRLAGSSDMSFMTIDELKTFKKITGGDSLYAEFKGEQPFEYTYNGLLWFCMNRLPKFGGDDGQWVYDRILVVNCPNVIPPEKQDKLLLDKMYAEKSGIIYKCISALQDVIKNGYTFTEPESVTNARMKYKDENNSVISFFTECMEKRANSKIEDSCTTGKVYDVYKAWCNDNTNGYSKTARDFRGQLAEHLNTDVEIIIIHTKKGNFYRDYTLSAETKKQYSKAYGYDEFMQLLE